MSQHREFACCHKGCMGIICLTPEQEEKFRESHDSFKCPMGHAQGFYGKTSHEKEIDRLERIIEARDRTIRYHSHRAERLEFEVLSLRARLGHKTRKLQAVA